MIWFILGTLELTEALEQGVFMIVSTLTTTGFQNANLRSWASVTLFFLTLLTFIGGASGSTAGGIKLHRVALGHPYPVLVVPQALCQRKGTPAFQD